jgi:transcriptional regulator with XRE-family HTH domain
MSYFGRNIRKIRAAKNISQSSFADLFKLTRASIGAYEEGRAEAKIDTIIEIAD